MNDFLRPPQKRAFTCPPSWEALPELLASSKLFELTACAEILPSLTDAIYETKETGEIISMHESPYFFQPFERIGIEIAERTSGLRSLLLCEEVQSKAGKTSMIRAFGEDEDNVPHAIGIILAPLDPIDYHRPPPVIPARESPLFRTALIRMATTFYVMLAAINSPKVIAHVSHQPHRGLQRSLRHAKIIGAAAGLRPWTEIKLDVAPLDEHTGEPSSNRLTGAKALHYCRSFIRIRKGRLERVRAHWRGDAALGVVRSRYSVRPHKPTADRQIEE